MLRTITNSVCNAAKLRVATSAPSRGIFQASKPSRGLEEFFTGYETTKVGRPWTAAELRVKSNEDLEKLHFVCLKELNMLQTYRHFIRHTPQSIMINPDRIKKVKRTMQLIQHVVGERRKIMGYVAKTPRFLEAEHKRKLIRANQRSKERLAKERATPKYNLSIQDKTARRKIRGSTLSPRTI